MTIQQFKKQHPEYAHLEGNQLWDTMENCMVKQQTGTQIIRSSAGFFKQYKLRKLFYYQLFPTTIFVQPNESSMRCTACKHGVSFRMIFINTDTDEESSPCPYCKKHYVPEPNTNAGYKWYKVKRAFKKMVVNFLNYICILGSNTDGRYGIFGDERRYVKRWMIDSTTDKVSYALHERKWWEYIFVKR